VGREGDGAGVVAGPGVGGAACGGTGTWDAALGGGSELTGGVSTDLSSSLCGGRNRVKGGLIGAAGGTYTGRGKYIGGGGGGGPPHQPTAHPAHAKQPPQPP
jgi:hypothetical protein